MTNTPNIAFAFLKQLFSFINNQKVDMTYSNNIFNENTTSNFPSVNKTLLTFGYKITRSALYVYCSLKTVQEQAQSTRSIKLTCHRHFNFLNFKEVALLRG